MKPRVPIVRPDLGEEEAQAAARVVRSGWVAQGTEVAALEDSFIKETGAPFAVAVSNCTSALELALRCVGVGPGDDVATVSHSFIATANSVLAVGARPVFVDIERETFGMDPRRLDQAITPRTKAVLCVHQMGFPCDLEGILDVSRRRGLPVVEDAACALGSEVRSNGGWERIGKPHGVVACFSLHPRKIVTTGDGGMLTTADPELARRFRRLRQHGLEAGDPVPGDAKGAASLQLVEPGYNLRLTDLQAAIARPQLARLAASLAERRRLAESFAAALARHPVLAPPPAPGGARPNWQSYPAVIRDGAPYTQAELLRFFEDRGISVRAGITNAHQELAYAKPGRWTCGPSDCGHASGRCERLPISEWARDHTVLLPLFQGMTGDERAAIISTIDDLVSMA